MKSGKIILGAVALIITASSAIAMKSHRSINQLFTKTKNSAGKTVCTLVSCWTKAGTGNSCAFLGTTKVYTKVACTKTWLGGRTLSL